MQKERERKENKFKQMREQIVTKNMKKGKKDLENIKKDLMPLFEEYKICEDMLLPFIDLFSLHDALMQRNVYILYASCVLNDIGDSLKVKKEKMLYLIEKVKDKKLLGRLNGMLKRMMVGAKTN